MSKALERRIRSLELAENPQMGIEDFLVWSEAEADENPISYAPGENRVWDCLGTILDD